MDSDDTDVYGDAGGGFVFVLRKYDIHSLGMQLNLWNTLGRNFTGVKPSHADGKVRVYNCGPTVYSTPHIGNIRRFLVADTMVRTLRFMDYQVISVMNITDVGHLLDEGHAAAGTDRMLLASQRESRSPEEVAAKYTQEFFAVLQEMRAEPADYYPRATMHIPQMIAMVSRLLTNGYAYETNSGIYFEVSKFTDYGKLSGNTAETVAEGARVAVREEKKSSSDFALWIKADTEHLMQWDSPWGRGYPGWHIECSAMAKQLLGETIDLHTGGIDNMFPHHENEIAQSEAANKKKFAHIWTHNEHLLVNGAKMSKSEGTFITLEDVNERGFSPLALRFLFLQTHYRSKLNFTWSALEAAAEGLTNLQNFVYKLQAELTKQYVTEKGEFADAALASCRDKFTAALADDLNTPQALAVIFDFIHEVNPLLHKNHLANKALHKIMDLMMTLDRVLALLSFNIKTNDLPITEEISELLEKRALARTQKNFTMSDDIRLELKKHGFIVKDTPDGQQLTPAPKP